MEPIKQEIINNIFENGDKLITGPILQTVLIDMIDDVNVKDQEILSKTGSWDDAVTQIPNLATKAEVTNLSESVARDLENVVGGDLTGYATEQWVESQGYLKEHQDISNLATKTELTTAENNLQGNITSLSESVARDLANVPEGVATEAWVQSQDYASKSYVDNAVSSSSVDLTGYATETWVQSQGYLKEHQDISGLATKTELNSVSESVQTDISNLATKGELNEAKNIIQDDMIILSGSMAKTIDDYTAGLITEIQNQDYASKTYVNDAISSSSVDLTGYATETWVQNQGYLKEHQDISNLATKTELTSVSESVQTDITNLSESVANSVVWKKGTGEDSIAQVIAKRTNPPTATGERAIATGQSTYASGECSHAEGHLTTAEGWNSHAEGFYTKASNAYEHAQGLYNHNSENQIFSIGTGNSNTDRRNALSVLAVQNNNKYTASVFVQNVGGYDGTNPTPGTNDLATVINGMSTGGGSSETLWKKGTGKDSIVQAIADGTYLPTATGNRAVAIGYGTTASGSWSHAEGESTTASGGASHAEGCSTKASKYGDHAEGQNTTASGSYSHAEGRFTNTYGVGSHAEGLFTVASKDGSHAEGDHTNASGQYSHAEGYFTSTSNNYEHAQGQYNYTSSNQIFSVGAGESINYVDTRRNAISVLAVPNSDTQVVTASFFVQNVGGYDGTNPLPGTNDLATVLNNTETWTFTLEDGSTVTKNVRIS